MKTYRATHRVETPGRPRLYCMREGDALLSAAERAPETSSVYILTRHPTTQAETWDFWRTAP